MHEVDVLDLAQVVGGGWDDHVPGWNRLDCVSRAAIIGETVRIGSYGLIAFGAYRASKGNADGLKAVKAGFYANAGEGVLRTAANAGYIELCRGKKGGAAHSPIEE